MVFGHRWRGEGDICGVLPPSSDFSGPFGGGVTGEGPSVVQAKRTLYVQALEVPSVDPVVGSTPLPLCSNCGMHVNAEKIMRHQRTNRCNRAT